MIGDVWSFLKESESFDAVMALLACWWKSLKVPRTSTIRVDYLDVRMIEV